MKPGGDESTAETVLRCTLEAATLALTLYVVWMFVPETAKMEVRSVCRVATAPLRDAASRRRARAEMMSDVVELVTYGPPVAWADTA